MREIINLAQLGKFFKFEFSEREVVYIPYSHQDFSEREIREIPYSHQDLSERESVDTPYLYRIFLRYSLKRRWAS